MKRILLALVAALVVAAPARARTIDEAQGDLFQADGLLVMRQFQAAYDRYRALLQEFPGTPRVVEGYVHAMGGLAKWEEVRTLVLSERQRTASALAYSRELVAADRALGRGDEAMEDCLLWWTANPADRRTQAVVDTLLLEGNHTESMLGAVRRAAAKAPAHTGLQEMLVTALARSGHGVEAREAALRYDRARRAEGSFALNLARTLRADGQRDEAVKTAEMVIKEFPGMPRAAEARVARDSWLRGTPRWNEARADLEALMKEQGSTPVALEAEMILAEGEILSHPEAARKRAQDLAQRFPQQAGAAWRVIGESNLAERKFTAAAAAFGEEAGVRIEGDEKRQALWNRAESFFYGAEFDSATAAYKIFAARYLRDGRSQDALSRALLIGDTEGNDPTLKAFAEASFIARNDPAKADTALASVIRRSPKSVVGLEATFQRAELKRIAGDSPAALTLYLTFEDSTITSPRSAEGIFRAAEIYGEKQSNPKRALELYSAVITRYTTSWLTPEARRRVEKLRRGLGS